MDDIEELRQQRDSLDKKISKAVHERWQLWVFNEDARLAMFARWYLKTELGITSDIDLEMLPKAFAESLTREQLHSWQKPTKPRRRGEVEDCPGIDSLLGPKPAPRSRSAKQSSSPATEAGQKFGAAKQPRPAKPKVSPPPRSSSGSGVAASHTIVAPSVVQTAQSKTYLYAGLHDRETIKALGGCWDEQAKRWYVPEGVDLAPFVRWL